MKPVNCDECDATLSDWQGNVMVDNDRFMASAIERLRVICKPCTNRLDQNGRGANLHNLWELVWVRDQPMYILGGVLSDMTTTPNSKKWSAEAADDLHKLLQARFPDTANSPL